jgi:hypothetical protein
MEENLQESPTSISIKKHIVVYGKHDYIVKNTLDLLTKADYSSAGFTLLIEAIDYLRMNSFDGVLMGGGVDPHDRMQIKNLLTTEFPHARIVEHFGGPATIISEVKSVFGDK